jgi:hypothetical protein
LPEVSCVEVIYRRKYGTTNNGTWYADLKYMRNIQLQCYFSPVIWSVKTS